MRYDDPYAKSPALATGMAAPQKTIKPVTWPGAQPPAAAPAASGTSWNDYLKSANNTFVDGGSIEGGFNNDRYKQVLGQVGSLAGFSGPATMEAQYGASGMNEGGETSYTSSGYKANPELLQALQNYSIGDTGDPYTRSLIDPSGKNLGSFTAGDRPSKFDQFAEKAIPVALGAMAGGAAFQGLGLGGPAMGNGAFLGEGVASGIPAWDAAYLNAGGSFAGGTGGIDFGSGDTGGGQGDFGGTGPDAPAEFRPSVDSQAYNAANGITSPVNPVPPSSVNLGSLGQYSTGGGMMDKIANALQSAQVNPAGAASSLGSSVLDFAKKNPMLALTGANAIGSLVGGSPSMPSTGVGGSGGSAGAAGAPAVSQGALDFSNIPGLKTTAGDRNTFNQEAIDAAYGQQTRYLDPQIQQQQKALEARLSEQGFVPGTPAYNQAMQNFMDTNQRAYASARDSSILQGAQIGQSDFRNAISDATLNNSAAAQALQSYITQRNQPINERNAVLTGDQILYDRNLDQYNAKVAESNSRNQSLSQLALALGMFLG